MAEYKVQKTGEAVKVSLEKGFKFPATGAKMLLKTRPPIAKEVSTD